MGDGVREAFIVICPTFLFGFGFEVVSCKGREKPTMYVLPPNIVHNGLPDGSKLYTLMSTL